MAVNPSAKISDRFCTSNIKGILGFCLNRALGMTFLQLPRGKNTHTHTHTHTISYIYLLESGPCTDRQGNTSCIAIWH
jgi:hypothetical protein